MNDTAAGGSNHIIAMLGIGLIAFLALIVASLFIVSNLGAPPTATQFGPAGGDAGPEGLSNQVANDFLLDLKTGRVEQAYGRTSNVFQQSQSLPQFRALMQKYPFPRPPGSNMATQQRAAARGVWVYNCRFTGSGGQIAFTFEVGKDGEQYRVVNFTMQ